MALLDQVIRYVYDLKDNISAKLKVITGGLKDNASASNAAANAAEKSARQQSEAYKKAADSIGGLRTALSALAVFVGFDKLTEGIKAVVDTGERLDDLSKEFANVFGGLDKGAAALDKVKEIAAGVPQGFEDVAAAAIRLRKAGFDPLDGTLQSLLDNQNATNQSQEQLIATIDALGKASIKGELGLKSFVSLTEAGIPVFELLGKAIVYWER